LPPKAGRRIARHLDQCPTCAAYYLRERELVHELTNQMRLVGSVHKPQLRQMWAAIQNGVTPSIKRRKAYKRLTSARYGVMALVFAFALALPATLGNRNVSFSITQPSAPVRYANEVERKIHSDGGIELNG